jgi:hypothetical protein
MVVGIGTITAVNNLELIIGSGTQFLTQLDTGDVIIFNGEIRKVETLISQTELIIEYPFTVQPSGDAFTLTNNVNTIGKYEKITLYETIEFTGSNTATVTEISGTTINTNSFGAEGFVLVSTVSGGYPTNVAPLDGGGDVITASIDINGLVTLSDPYTGDLAIIYGIDVYESRINTIDPTVQARFVDAIGTNTEQVNVVQDIVPPSSGDVPSTQAVVDYISDLIDNGTIVNDKFFEMEFTGAISVSVLGSDHKFGRMPDVKVYKKVGVEVKDLVLAHVDITGSYDVTVTFKQTLTGVLILT